MHTSSLPQIPSRQGVAVVTTARRRREGRCGEIGAPFGWIFVETIK